MRTSYEEDGPSLIFKVVCTSAYTFVLSSTKSLSNILGFSTGVFGILLYTGIINVMLLFNIFILAYPL